MILKLGLCTYEKTEDKNFLRNITLSGCMGTGAMLGNDYLIKAKETYIVHNATQSDIRNIPIGAHVTEIKPF